MGESERSSTGPGAGCTGAGIGGVIVGVFVVIIGVQLYLVGSGYEPPEPGNPVEAVAWLFRAAGVIVTMAGAFLALGGLGGLIMSRSATSSNTATAEGTEPGATPEINDGSTVVNVPESDGPHREDVPRVESRRPTAVRSVATGCLGFVGIFVAVIVLDLVLTGGQTSFVFMAVISAVIVILRTFARRK